MAFAYLIFTVGVVFFLLLQLAVYNTRTLPLNSTIMKSNKTSTTAQMIIMGLAMGIPLILDSLFTALFSETIAYTLLTVIGLAFIATHNLWIKNIYNRFMKRRYENMEAFRSSR